MNELSPTNQFGELLLNLIDAQYGGDDDAGISALVESTGLSEEEVVAIINGDTIVEDESLLSDIVAAFPDADDNDLEVIINTASEVDEQDRSDLIAQIEADEDAAGAQEDPEAEAAEYPEDGGEEASYSRYVGRRANFSREALLENKLAEMENRFAQFEAYSALSSELKAIEQKASQLVDAQILPPSFKAMLIGNFSDDSERVAKFGAIADRNQVDVEKMLFATKYALGMLEDSAQFMEFRDFSITEDEAATANFSASLDTQVQADLDAIFNS